MILNVFTDGASRGNPGEAAIGVIGISEDEIILFQEHKYLGTATNNIAEYSALFYAIEKLQKIDNLSTFSEIIFHTDSELMARQLTGIYKVKDEELKKMFMKVKSSLVSLPIQYTIKHIPRAQNKKADLLANEALDAHQKK